MNCSRDSRRELGRPDRPRLSCVGAKEGFPFRPSVRVSEDAWLEERVGSRPFDPEIVGLFHGSSAQLAADTGEAGR